MNLFKLPLRGFRHLSFLFASHLIKKDFRLVDLAIRERRNALGIRAVERFSGTVQEGPFKGMKLNRPSIWSEYFDHFQKLSGGYEREVQEQLTSFGFKRNFIDVGAADGYFAVGMILAGLATNVVCFEIDENSRELISKNAEDNGVVVNILGGAGADFLEDLRALKIEPSESTILIDIEGAEFGLLTREVFQGLRGANIIVENHDFMAGASKSELIRAASPHFRCDILSASVSIGSLTSIYSTNDDKLLANSEGRPRDMEWLVFSPVTGTP